MPTPHLFPVRLRPAVLALVGPILSAQPPLLDQGKAAILRGDGEAAIQFMESAAARSPQDAEVQFWLGNAYSTRGEQAGMIQGARYASKAREAWERTVALNPRHLEARLRLAEFFAMVPGIMGGSFDKAFAQAREIKVLDPVLGHRAFGIIFVQKKDPAAARREYVEALRQFPNSPQAHTYFGQHLAYAEKNYGAAHGEFESSLKLDPSFMPAYFQLGRAAAVSGENLARGEAVLRKYVAYTPKDHEPSHPNAYYYLGLIAEKAGRSDEAQQHFQAALRLNPSLKKAAEALARVGKR